MEIEVKTSFSYAKKELGTFCEQYGFDPLIAPYMTYFSFFDFLDYHNKKISVTEKTLSQKKIENHENVYQTYLSFELVILIQSSGVQVLTTSIKRPSQMGEYKSLEN